MDGATFQMHIELADSANWRIGMGSAAVYA